MSVLETGVHPSTRRRSRKARRIFSKRRNSSGMRLMDDAARSAEFSIPGAHGENEGGRANDGTGQLWEPADSIDRKPGTRPGSRLIHGVLAVDVRGGGGAPGRPGLLSLLSRSFSS